MLRAFSTSASDLSMVNFYIVLAGIEINRVKTDSARVQPFAGTQGQWFGACSKLIKPPTGLKPFDCGLLKLSTHAPVSLSHGNTILMYGYRYRDGTRASGKHVAYFCDSKFGLTSP